MTKKLGLLLGPTLFLAIHAAPIELLPANALTVVALAMWMISWWITEAVSISVTALLPLVIFSIVWVH